MFSWHSLLCSQDLEMVFNEDRKEGGGILKPAVKDTQFGVLQESCVILHAINSTE